MERPNRNEYPEAYQPYLDQVEPGNFMELLDQNTKTIIALFESMDDKTAKLKYAEDKWTIKEVLMHIIDTERGLSYRAIVCTRNDTNTQLYTMDEKSYAQNADVTKISMKNLIEEFIAVRKAFKFIYLNNPKEKFNNLANGIDYNVSARAIGYFAIGHAKHHCTLINQKYLS